MSLKRPFNVLFLCTHNSARSIVAEAVMSRLGKPRFNGFSAGSMPSGKIQPLAIEMLRRLNYDISKLRSKSWEEFARQESPKLDFVFTLCDDAANEACPVWPGQPMTAHWGLPDPSAVQGTDAERAYAYADTHRMLHQRISIFVNLPIESLDKLTLQKRIDDIGKTTGDIQRESA